jgi:superfamily II DNA or RNA helicase
MSDTDELEYDSPEKRTSQRAMNREILMRIGEFKRQVVFLSAIQEPDHSFAKMLQDSGADPQSFVMIDSSESNIEKCQKNWSTSTCLAGFWCDKWDEIADEPGFRPILIHLDLIGYLEGPKAKQALDDCYAVMSREYADPVGFVVTIPLKKGCGGKHYDGNEKEPNIIGTGRKQFLDNLSIRLGKKLSDRWGLGSTGDREPLVGFYRQHKKRIPMGSYMFFDGPIKKRTTTGDDIFSPNHEKANRSVSQVTEFFQPASTLTQKKKRVIRELWKNQKSLQAKAIEWLESKKKRALAVGPCSAGKTFSEVTAIMDHMRLIGGSRYCIFTPRRALSQQICEEFNRLRDSGINVRIVAVNSGQKYVMQRFAGDEGNVTIIPNTNVKAIKAELDPATPQNPVVIFCLYQSAKKLKRALGKNKLDLAVCDEAHFVSSEDVIQMIDPTNKKRYVPAKKWLFLTATPRIDPRDPYLSMDNTKMFGERIHTYTPMELWLDGKCVIPRLIPLNIDPKILGRVANDPVNGSTSGDYYPESVAIMHSVLSALKKEDKSYRLVAWCNDAHTQPLAFLGNQILRADFSDTYFAFITHNKCMYLEPGPRSSAKIRPANRSTVLENVASYPKSVLFHFDVLTVGIDVPAFTDMLWLRSVKSEARAQGMGRGMRPHPDDKEYLTLPDPTMMDEIYKWRVDKLTKPYVRVWLGINPKDAAKAESGWRSHIEALTDMDQQFLINNVLVHRGKKQDWSPYKGLPREFNDPNVGLATSRILELSASVHAEIALKEIRRVASQPLIVNFNEKDFDLLRKRMERAKPGRKGAVTHVDVTCKVCSQSFSYLSSTCGRKRVVCDTCKKSHGGRKATLQARKHKRKGKCNKCRHIFTFVYTGGPNRKTCDDCMPVWSIAGKGGRGRAGAWDTMRANEHVRTTKCAECKDEFSFTYKGGRNKRFCEPCRRKR